MVFFDLNRFSFVLNLRDDIFHLLYEVAISLFGNILADVACIIGF